MKIKRVMTYSPRERKIRLCRIVWRPVKGDPGYSRSLSLSLWPRILRFWRESGTDVWFLTVLGVQMHFKKSCHGDMPD